MLINLTNCLFGYEKRPVVAVDELRIEPGHCLGIFGPNGSGKTTLVRGMTGLLAPMQGTVERPCDLRIGYLPQNRALELQWPMTGLDAASLALSARLRLGRIDRAVRRNILDSMSRLDVKELAHRPFAKLSGGQQQRLLLAGALAAEPQVLVLDEPTDGLDVRSRHALLVLLQGLARQGLSTVIISHEVEDLMLLANSVAWLHPAQTPDEPSHVEILPPQSLAERILHARQAI
jgi:ABC-type Mn2+/Zn2+ transport system ATPase subunit